MAYQYFFRQSPNYTPGSQTASVWGRGRSIEKIAIHHWGDPASNPTFEGVVDYLCRPGGGSSAHYVAEAGRVAQLVYEADNAWATNNANPYSVAIECNPRASDGDFETIGELIANIWKRLGDKGLIRHKDIVATACPGRYSDQLQRLVDIANKYLAPPPPPTPEWQSNRFKIEPTETWYAAAEKVPVLDLANFANSIVKDASGKEVWLTKGQEFKVGGATKVGGHSYLVSEYSFANNKPHGVREWEMSRTPIVEATPVPTPPPLPEWEANKKDYQAPVILYANKADVQLYDITTGQPDAGVAPFPLGKVFDQLVRETVAQGTKYYISKYSADRNIWKGFREVDLALEAPRPAPPAPNDPTPPEVAGTDRIGGVEKEVEQTKKDVESVKAEVSGLKALLEKVIQFLRELFKKLPF